MAERGLKAMIPFGRPFLDYGLSMLADAGYKEVCLVIGPEHGAVEHYYRVEAPPRRLRVHFAIQREPRGTADALLAAEQFVSGEDFVCMNSDNLYPVAALERLRELDESGVPLFDRETLLAKGNISAEKIRKYAICEVSDDGYLRGIVEKPDDSLCNAASGQLISMNCWRFSADIFEVCRKTPLSPRGEYELPVAVGQAIQRFGMRFRVVRCFEGVLDLSSRADVATVGEKLGGLLANP